MSSDAAVDVLKIRKAISEMGGEFRGGCDVLLAYRSYDCSFISA